MADIGPGVGRPRAESALMGGPERPGPLLAQLYSGTVQRRRPWDQVAFTALTARVGEARASCEGISKEGRKQEAAARRTGVAVAVGGSWDQPQHRAGTVPRI